jgi:hypothetical protein
MWLVEHPEAGCRMPTPQKQDERWWGGGWRGSQAPVHHQVAAHAALGVGLI